MLTFNLKTTFFTVKTSNEVYCCRIYFFNYIQNVHIIKRTLHGSSKIWILCSRGNALTREILFLPLELKIHIFSQPCNILYIYTSERALSVYIEASRRRAAICTDKSRSRLLSNIAKSWLNACGTRISFTEDAQYTWMLP